MMVAASLLAVALSPAFAASSYYQEGLKLMQAERYEEAVHAFEKEAAQNPGSAEVLMNLGWSYWKVNRIDDAWRCFDLLAKLDPRNASYLRLLAETEIGRKEFPHALDHADRALKLLPGDKDASIVKSSALIGLQRHEEADRILRELVARYPDSAPVRFHMADNLAAMNRLDESLQQFDALMRLTPDNGDYRRARANVLYAMGREPEAIAEWKALANRVPPDEKSIINLGYAAWKDKDLDAAYAYGKRLVTLHPDNATYLRFLGGVQIERGDPADALRLAQRALDILGHDKDAALLKAKALFNLYRDREAMAAITELLREYPDDPRIVFAVADFLEGMDRRQEALVFYDRLVKAYPDNLVYRYRRADLKYEMGQYDAAVAEWKDITDRNPAEVKALARLVDDAESRSAWDEALIYMQRLAGRKALDAAGWEQVASLYSSLRSYPQAIAAADKAIRLDPSDQSALFLKADTQEQMQDLDGAEKSFHELLARNPNSLRTLAALGRIAEEKGDYPRAIRLIHTMRKLSFSDATSSPYYDILEARLLADSGHIERAMRVLHEKATKKRISIPVLLYHGVSENSRAGRFAVPAKAFAEQMEAIKKAGYSPITIQQLVSYREGHAALPNKPIVVSFDDARADAFRNGDPVLQASGMKATMFVHLTNANKRLRYYSSGPLLKKWSKTGRWEVQGHSDKAHESIPIDDAGHKGHFLSNRQWLPEKRRLENLDEFSRRIDADFKDSKRKLDAMFPDTRIVAYAFPFGDMGQTDFTNTPEAPTLNWQAVHRYYKLAFTQDQFGFNRVPSRSADMTRWEIKRDMTTKDVMHHLTMEEPWIKAKMMEADFWIRTNQPGRALAIYENLRNDYAINDAELYGGEAMAYDMFGNGHVARQRYAQALEQDPGVDKYREMSAISAARDTPRVGAEGSHFNDGFTDNTRAVARYSQPVSAARIEPFAGKAFFGQSGQSSLGATELGAGLRWFPTPRARVDADITNRSFSEGLKRHTQSGNAALSVPFFAPFRIGAKGGVNDVETRAGVAQGINYKDYGGFAQWDIALNWALQGDYEEDHYSDQNLGHAVTGLLTRHIGTLWTLGYAARFSQTRFSSPAYYSPGHTTAHTALVTLGSPFGPIDLKRNLHRGEGSLTLLGGYGVTDGRSRFIEGIKGAIGWRIVGGLLMTANAQYAQSPAYVSRTIGVGLGLDL